MGIPTNFTSIDWVIVAAYLLGTLVIGLYANRLVRGMADYLVAGRSLRASLAIATMVGTELGLVTVMYAAQKGFTGGFAAFHIGLVAGVATLVVGLTGFIVVPLRKLEVMTIPEFYEHRFGRGVRVLGGLLLALSGILNMGLFLKAGAIFVTGLTGLADPFAVKMVMTAMIVLVLFYTILGGMVSVVITDYVQFVVLSFGLLATVGLAVNELGIDAMVRTVETVHGSAGFDPFDETGFGPSYVIWMIFTAGIVSCAVWQTAVVRALAVESAEIVRRLYTFSSIGFTIRFLVPQFLGVAALAYFFADPSLRPHFFTESGAPIAEASLSALPIFLGKLLPTGLVGLVGAGMLAAFMSTHDSYLLCWASVLAQDVVSPLVPGGLSSRARLLVARILIFVIGVFLLVWSLWYPLGQDLWDYMAVSGAIYFTGAFAVLLLGLYWKRASTAGAYVALLAGTLAIFGLEPLRALLGIDGLTSAHVGLTATGLALGGMVAGSLIAPRRETS